MSFSFGAAGVYLAKLYMHEASPSLDKTDLCDADSLPDFPKECYRFQLFKIPRVVGVEPFIRGTAPSYIPVTGFCYLGGKELTLEQLRGLEAEQGGLVELLQLMEENGLRKAVKTDFGKYIPLSANDVVLKR
jgi:hypothetical protein